MRPCDGTSGLVRGNLRKAVFAFNRLFFQRNSLRFSLRDARRRRVFWKCGEKSEITEHNPIFGNKTAGRESVKSGSGRSISVFPALPVFASVGDRVHLYPRLDNGQNSQLRLHTKTPAGAKLLLPALACLLVPFRLAQRPVLDLYASVGSTPSSLRTSSKAAAMALSMS